jgi:predicted MFS family arabinose efflux permease
MAGLALGYLGLSRVGGDLDLFLASVLAMAMAACGTTPIVWTRIVNGWFDAARGAALALTLVGTGVAAVFGPPFVTAVMRDHGWRGAYVGLAIATAILAIPPVALLLRGSVRKAAAHEPAQTGVSAGEAIRLWDFWAIIASFLLISTCVSGGIVHLVPLLTDAGASAALAARLAGALGLAVVAGRLVIGALLDRFPAKYVAGVSLSLPIAGFVLLAQGAGSTPVAAIAAMTFGFSAGAEVDLIAFLTSRYFGLKAYGKIYSWALVPFALGGGLGPLAAGRVFDAFGSYRPALYGAAAMLSLGVLLLQTLGRYRFARLANDGTANDGAAEGHGAYPPPIAEAG